LDIYLTWMVSRSACSDNLKLVKTVKNPWSWAFLKTQIKP